MTQATRSISLGAALILLSCAASGAEQVDAQFDTRGFLDACTGFVPDVDLAIPMDGECVNQARRMCVLSYGGSGKEQCLQITTAWLHDETRRIWQGLPEDARGGHAAPPTADQMATGTFAPVPGVNPPDCDSVEVPGVSTSVVCTYADAVQSWHAVRILQRSASDAEPDKE